jgi:hypothetical protein
MALSGNPAFAAAEGRQKEQKIGAGRRRDPGRLERAHQEDRRHGKQDDHEAHAGEQRGARPHGRGHEAGEDGWLASHEQQRRRPMQDIVEIGRAYRQGALVSH